MDLGLGILLIIATYSLLAIAQSPSAREVMARVYRQDTSRDITLRATLEVMAKGGEAQRKRILLYRLGSPGNSKTLVRFTDPLEMRGVALLSLNRQGESDRQWIYTPATQRARRVAPRDRSESFAGTDFSYEDIAERVLDDFSYSFLSAADIIEGRKTIKIKAVPVAPERSQYQFIYYWVAEDVPVILHAELYDKQGKLVRRFHASRLRKASGIWGARRMEMSSASTDSRTILTIEAVHFNAGLRDDLFVPEALGKTAPGSPSRAKTP
jgi:outer membrane lipoprotein-sorting protein